jgi:hypothetical protein
MDWLANLRNVPISKRKPGRRGPLQRLSDSRRSLALGGLALGAVFSAGFFRRRRRAGEIEFERPAPAAAPSAPAESGPPAAVEVPLPASSTAAAGPIAVAPEAAGNGEATTAINATAGEPATPAGEEKPAVEEAPAPSEPATGELSAEEASILAVLAQSGRADEDRTAIAVATSLERETTDVAAVLRKLSGEGVVSGELYTSAGDKIWAVTERGVRRLGAQH